MSSYTGRFAPSPTGALHAGSLVAALASYLDAKAHGGRWLLRIDDADLSRVQAGAAETIVQQLCHYGLQWDGAVTHTQDFRLTHQAAVQTLNAKGLLYACACTRAQLSEQPVNPASGERVYSGTCQSLGRALSAASTRALRLRVGDAAVSFNDRCTGAQTQHLASAVGDFVVWRPESIVAFEGGLHSYQLTMPVDDAAQGVTHVVRGADLLGSTARQLYVYDCLGLTRPSHWHVPVVLMDNGLKLSKQNHAPALPSTDPLPELERALVHLGLSGTGAVSLPEFWRSAAAAWEKQLLVKFI